MKLLFLLLLIPMLLGANNREKYNFNSQWLLHIGDVQGGEKLFFTDKDWKKITLPRAFNEDEAFKVAIKEMTDTVSWYRKHFKLPKTAKGKKVFNQTLFTRLFGLVGKHGTEQTGTNDEIIVLFHVLFPFCRSCFRRSLFLGEIILVDSILNAATCRLRGDML